MKIGKAPELPKKAAAMCKSKTTRLLILASLQRRRMATAAVVSRKIDALIMADWERADRHKALALGMVEKKPVINHESDLEANFSRHLVMFGQENGHGRCHTDRMHSFFNNDQENFHYTDDDDVELDSCDQDDDDEPSVMDVIKNNREVEGLEFNMEEEIDQAADMFIRRFRQRLNEGF
ncbi:hypothetical protein CFC21_072505 [Triticum aestivum]|uniref:Uncharacterized protein n=3 Tax=Triticum TaxID=4564 RepID=A0A9R1KU79_WHEAT|nr:uncharacterized protein LOC123116536 [Triticum aestivum]KAF7042588.1 hypothetical protein CFC21_052150 [Triticum aestivum]KAF7066534.1 hypothetical protein CFC21_072505 [Triticum aestivum]VAI34427.1 unnamed protein product [Triticum turgidum subsp. durum]